MAAEAPGDMELGSGTRVCLATCQRTFPSSQAQLLGICLVPAPGVAMAGPRPAVHRPAGWTPTQALVHVARLEDCPPRPGWVGSISLDAEETPGGPGRAPQLGTFCLNCFPSASSLLPAEEEVPPGQRCASGGQMCSGQ